MFELEALPQVETGRYGRVGPQVQENRPGNVLPALPAIASYMLFNVDSVAIVLAALTCAAKERQPNTFTLMPSAARRQAARKASAGQRKHPTERIQPPSLVAHGSLRGLGVQRGPTLARHIGCLPNLMAQQPDVRACKIVPRSGASHIKDMAAN